MLAKLKYFNQLDGLRAVAAFSVVLFHFIFEPKFTLNLLKEYPIVQSLDLLQHGVTLFFVLSGFVITRILLNTKYQRNYFQRFYKNRILRIFPLYYFYLSITYFIFPLVQGLPPNFEFKEQMPFYFFLQNLNWLTNFKTSGPGHFWSLAVEEHFYLIWPLIINLVPRKSIKILVLVLILLSIPLKAFLIYNTIDINYNSVSRFDSILIGCFIAVIEQELEYKLPRLNKKYLFYSFFTLLLVGIFFYIFKEPLFFYKSILKHLILGMLFGLLVYFLISSPRHIAVNRFLESNSMQYFGKISFGIYVWHILAFQIVLMFSISSMILNFLFSMFITIILSHLSFYYFEKRFLALK